MTGFAPQNESPIEALVDPVCGAAITSDQVNQRYTWRDIDYVFDSADCLQQFLEDPEKFIHAPRELGD